MNECCVENIESMHELVNYTWWFQVFVLSSPFILLIPNLNPAAGNSKLIQTSILNCGQMSYGIARNNLQKNQTRPDFVDAVKAIEKFKFDRLRLFATSHMLKHTRREQHIANLWQNIAIAYDKAFFS